MCWFELPILDNYFLVGYNSYRIGYIDTVIGIQSKDCLLIRRSEVFV